MVSYMQRFESHMARRFRVPPDLLTVRHKSGLSLHDIAGITKISVYYLQAIEEGEFTRLPGGVYDTSYIRQYAKLIDYDEEELLDCYRKAMGLDEPKPIAPQPKRPNGRWAWLAKARVG